MNNDIQIFKGCPVIAGFTRKPDCSSDRREYYRRIAEDPEDARIRHLIRPQLVHGRHVEVIDEHFLKGRESYIEIPECDGLVTSLKKVMLTTTHGDCIPVYAFDPVKKAIGLSHAGWKGTKLGIAGEMIGKMKASFGSDPADILCFIGPGIDKCHFETGADVAGEFLRELPWSERFITEAAVSGKYMIDLKSINAEFLKLAGISDISISPDCTYCLADAYYSYRRSADTKRMLAYIIL